MTREGGCLCGALRYRVEGEPRETVHCHCRMCQKAGGAGFLTWATFTPEDALAYTTGTPAIYRSSGTAQREFCRICGSQLVFRGDLLTSIDVTVGTLDDPDSVRPIANTWTTSRRVWLHGFDGALPDLQGEWPGDEI
jgi:hypothetical protein